jgi:hypothetical protein
MSLTNKCPKSHGLTSHGSKATISLLNIQKFQNMLRHLLQITTFILALGLLGCSSTKWTHPTLGESDFYKDRELCNQYANVSNPNTAPPYNPYLDPIQQANASMYAGGANLGRAIGMNAAFNSCMSAKGYRKN